MPRANRRYKNEIKSDEQGPLCLTREKWWKEIDELDIPLKLKGAVSIAVNLLLIENAPSPANSQMICEHYLKSLKKRFPYIYFFGEPDKKYVFKIRGYFLSLSPLS